MNIHLSSIPFIASAVGLGAPAIHDLSSFTRDKLKQHDPEISALLGRPQGGHL
jgi:hypothetical protein